MDINAIIEQIKPVIEQLKPVLEKVIEMVKKIDFDAIIKTIKDSGIIDKIVELVKGLVG